MTFPLELAVEYGHLEIVKLLVNDERYHEVCEANGMH